MDRGRQEGERTLRQPAAAILAYNLALVVWLLLKPGGHAAFVAVDDVAQFVGPLLALPLCVRGPRPGAGARAPVLIGLSVLGYVVGQMVGAYDEVVLGSPEALPVWAAAAFASSYPCMLTAVLMLPARPLPLAVRARLLLDATMATAAAATFSWYFLLGPLLLQGRGTLFDKVAGTAIPLCDLVLICCLLLVLARPGHGVARPAVRLLATALGVIVLTDSAFQYHLAHGTYATGGLIDVGWPLATMLAALGAAALRLPRAAEGAPGDASRVAAPPLWRVLLPYALVPAVGALLVYAWPQPGDPALRLGVLAGGVALLALVLLRQLLALVETRRLSERLGVAYQDLERNHAALAVANARLEALATTDALTGVPNHRALVAALDHAVDRARRAGQPCAVLLLDLDHFKALNDGYGHPAGDAALGELTTVAQGALRAGDTLGRWGGEEFLVILPAADAATAVTVGERLRAAVAAHAFAACHGGQLTISVGAAAYPMDARTREGLVAAADRALYAAKRLGRNQVHTAGEPAATGEGDGAAGDGGGKAREEAALLGTVEALVALVAAHDRASDAHADAVAELATRLARALGLDAGQVRMVGLAARLRDIGTVAVPAALLRQRGRMAAEERVALRAHAVVGAEVVAHVPALRALAPTIHSHHERWDGTGYPDGLAGEEIPLGARIIAVADAYAYGTRTADGRQGRSRPPHRTPAVVRRGAGTEFDPRVVAALEQALADRAGPDPSSARPTAGLRQAG